MGGLALAWLDRFEDIAAEFPALQGFGVSITEPFCFRCGWQAPTKSAFDYPERWKEDRAIAASWDQATGWLERAHLRDHMHGGDESPENMVALCVLCHEEQPICRTREEGVAFIRSQSPRHRIRFWLQIASDRRYRERPSRGRPGKAKALRGLLRAQGDVALVLAEAAEKTLKEVS